VVLPPAPGHVWRINMYRMDVPQGKPQQASGWSPPMVGDFHALDKFGEVVFADEKGNVPKVVTPPPPSAATLAGNSPAPAGGEKKATASVKGGGHAGKGKK
jgi:hypothetical protein